MLKLRFLELRANTSKRVLGVKLGSQALDEFGLNMKVVGQVKI